MEMDETNCYWKAFYLYIHLQLHVVDDSTKYSDFF